MNRGNRSVKLSTLFILYLSVFVIILSAALISFFSYQIKKTYSSRLIEFGAAASSLFALDCVEPLFSETYSALNEIIAEYLKLPDVVSFTIANRSNLVVASRDKGLIGKKYWEKGASGGYTETKNNIHFVQAVQLYGRTLGYLYLTFSKENITGAIRRMVINWIFFSLIIVLIIIILASFAARRITSFFKGIIEVTLKISRGDYAEKAKARGFYELEVIASAINTMEKAIEEREKSNREINNTLRMTNSMMESIINSPPEISIWSVDKNYCYTLFNKAHKLGMKSVWGADIEIGRDILDYLRDTPEKPDYRNFVKNRYDEVFEGKNFSIVEKHTRSSGETVYVETHSSPIMNENNEVAGLTIFATNITKRKMAENRIEESLKEKETLLKEIHHRVKNNLQVVSSLLNLQLDRIQSSEDSEVFTESINRINSIAMIHERLYSSTDLARIDMQAYFSDLFSSIKNTFNLRRPVKLVSDVDSVYLNIDQAVPLGLICNEIFTNSFKYAFSDEEHPFIEVNMKKEDDGSCSLEIRDNGSGFEKPIDPGKSETLGIVLINALTEQLYGTSTIAGKGHGVVFNLRFPGADAN